MNSNVRNTGIATANGSSAVGRRAPAASPFAPEACLKIIGLKHGGFDQAEPASDPFRRHVATYDAWHSARTCGPDTACRVSVPTLLDTRLIAWHLGRDHPATFEIEDQAMAAAVEDSIRRIGVDHAEAVYFEFLDLYKERGLEFRRIVPAGEVDGRIIHRNKHEETKSL